MFHNVFLSAWAEHTAFFSPTSMCLEIVFLKWQPLHVQWLFYVTSCFWRLRTDSSYDPLTSGWKEGGVSPLFTPLVLLCPSGNGFLKPCLEQANPKRKGQREIMFVL